MRKKKHVKTLTLNLERTSLWYCTTLINLSEEQLGNCVLTICLNTGQS